MEKYKVDKNIFSTADLSVLLMGLASISNMIRGNELVNALAKVKSFIPADKAKDIEVKVNQKSVLDRVLDFCSYEDFSPDGNEHYILVLAINASV